MNQDSNKTDNDSADEDTSDNTKEYSAAAASGENTVKIVSSTFDASVSAADDSTYTVSIGGQSGPGGMGGMGGVLKP